MHCDKWSDDDGRLWNAGVLATLRDRTGPRVKQEDQELWIAIVPEEGKGDDACAAELERIAGVLDELAERRLAHAEVLAEVSRRYEQPVMSNTHRAEYVEALVALVLKDSGWTRKASSDAWHLERESGVRLKLTHSAAMQSWGNGDPQSSPRFGIAPGKMH